jgi:hypothetical protein
MGLGVCKGIIKGDNAGAGIDIDKGVAVTADIGGSVCIMTLSCAAEGCVEPEEEVRFATGRCSG